LLLCDAVLVIVQFLPVTVLFHAMVIANDVVHQVTVTGKAACMDRWLPDLSVSLSVYLSVTQWLNYCKKDMGALVVLAVEWKKATRGAGYVTLTKIS